MDKEICTIFIGNGQLDDDFTFYESGKIKRFFDQSIYKPNLEVWIEPNDIIDSKKQKLIEKCAPAHKERIVSILYPKQPNS